MERFITFEGIEGCGKTTQIKMAGEYLAGCRTPCLLTAEPGGSPLGGRIREILLNRGPWAISSEAEVFLFLAARAQHVQETIIPALNTDTLVLCDRFSDATLAYQGFGRGLEIALLRRMNALASPSLKPALTILFDLPVEEGLARAKRRIAGNGDRAAEDRFEQEGMEFHRKVREGYLTLAREEPERFRIVDGAQDIAAVHREVRAHLDSFLNG